jgi:hypothetical protein
MAEGDRMAELETRLRGAWSRESSSLWSADNPARGQCNPTALVVQDILGGELLKTPTREGPHFYNRVGGRRLDFTASQFPNPPLYEDLPATREEVMASTSQAQYEALTRRLSHVCNR